jgi:hypothetical protein
VTAQRQAENIVQLVVGEQAGVGGDPSAAELELETAVERDPAGVSSLQRKRRSDQGKRARCKRRQPTRKLGFRA